MQGEHVVVYPGAGSHATYIERGEYIMRLPLPGEQVLHGVLDFVRRTWRDTLNQPDPGDLAEALKRLVSVPFVDYARGDGVTVGPGQEVEWTPIVISDAIPWVDGYRGLWGLDTGDRLAGERAPAGPKYTREGTVRQAWNDPIGFVGLSGSPTPAEARGAMVERIAELEAERATVEAEAETLARDLPKLGIEVRALQQETGAAVYRQRRIAELRAGEAKLAALRASSAELKASITAGNDFLRRYDAGSRGDPRGHLLHAAAPEPPDLTKRRVFAETWAALSVGVLVISLAVILWFRILPIAPTLLLLVIGYLAIESFAQRRVESLLLRITVALAVISAILLGYNFLRELVLLGLGALGLFILLDNAGELGRSRTRKGDAHGGEAAEPVVVAEAVAGPIVRAEPEAPEDAPPGAVEQPAIDPDELDLLPVAPPTPPEWEPPGLRRPTDDADAGPDDTQEWR